MTHNYRGTELKKEEIDKGKVTSFEYHPSFVYRWSTGIAITGFLEGLKDGKIIGSECPKCRQVVVPPRLFCEWCFVPMKKFVELKDTGTINTFSISYIATDASRVKEPQIPAVIMIDGTTNNEKGFLHLIGETNPEQLKIGLRVKAVWKDKNERKGDITDIKYFKPMR